MGDERSVVDVVWEAVLRAPVIEDDRTGEEREAEMAAMADTSGPFLSHEKVMAEIRKMAEAEGAGAEYDEIVRRRGG